MIKEMCLRCGYSEFSGALQIHHIDGNHLNDSRENKIILCSNCHITYHQNHVWSLESIGRKEPIQNREWYLRTKKGLKSKEHKLELMMSDVETMRTELIKERLMSDTPKIETWFSDKEDA